MSQAAFSAESAKNFLDFSSSSRVNDTLKTLKSTYFAIATFGMNFEVESRHSRKFATSIKYAYSSNLSNFP